ncbi:MmoB/DmpM family protein [Pseudonocardia sp. H11422]|uniref:MmoB/DmpM family protein n=1 Tax=Pseudonocardia sp. H11422 TaxID=2835866 RepID=UPI0027E35AC8|nr:MmoB/DmpM family protein [Pseudonocardia sp. H11422]
MGPVLRMCDEVESVISAIRDDNPDSDIEVIDRGSYIRVQAPGRVRVTETLLQRHLGPAFELRSLQTMLSSFAGRIHTTSEEISWEWATKREGATR